MIDNLVDTYAHTTVMEVDLRAVVRNLDYFRARINSATKLVAMIKASGYGCGSIAMAQLLEQYDVSYLAVAFVTEGIELRQKGIAMPIIVLNANENSYDQMIAYSLEPELYSLRTLKLFAEKLSQKKLTEYPVHLKLDTGMHRLGFERRDIEELAESLKLAGSTLRVASIFTHFSSADMEEEKEFTRSQVENFWLMANTISETLNYRPLCHMANSAGMLNYTDCQADMCRLGIGLYGFGNPSDSDGVLTPAATLKSKIIQIKEVAAGQSVGYAQAAKLQRDSIIAVVTIGYADGLDRHLSCGRWSLLVKGERAPIVGRVSMDSVMIDITDIQNVEVGEWATVFSPQDGNTPYDMANVLGTIPYEVMTTISARVKRVYINESAK